MKISFKDYNWLGEVRVSNIRRRVGRFGDCPTDLIAPDVFDVPIV